MKEVYRLFSVFILLSLTACSSEQSLQEYYVSSTKNPGFLSFDLPASLLNLEQAELTTAEREAVESVQKLNILAFKKNEVNTGEYEVEKAKIGSILSNADYTQLMKMNTEFGKATVQFLGDDEAIDEVIIFGSSDDKGFALIRVLGDGMNPAHIMQLIQAIQKSDYKGEGLEKIQELFKS